MVQSNAVLTDELERLAPLCARDGRAARVLAETESTNDDAKAWARKGAPHRALVVADSQSRGRGRLGRAWSTPPGQTLALSVVLRPKLDPAVLSILSLLAGLATRDAIDARAPGARIKWPNDVVFVTNEAAAPMRKIAGVLVEASLEGARVDFVVVGVGVNVARTSFPDELPAATSLALEGAHDLDRAALALDIARNLDAELDGFEREPAASLQRFARFDALHGRRVVLEAIGRDGTADGVDADGRLRVRLDDGEIARANAGEVSLAR